MSSAARISLQTVMFVPGLAIPTSARVANNPLEATLPSGTILGVEERCVDFASLNFVNHERKA